MNTPVVGLERVESAANVMHTPQGDRPYVELRLWTFASPNAPTQAHAIRMSHDQAREIMEHLRLAIAAPSQAASTRPPSGSH
jgi:hypothetical protein